MIHFSYVVIIINTTTITSRSFIQTRSVIIFSYIYSIYSYIYIIIYILTFSLPLD